MSYLYCYFLNIQENEMRKALTHNNKVLTQVGELSILLCNDFMRFIIHFCFQSGHEQTGGSVSPTGFGVCQLEPAAISSDFKEEGVML